MVITNLKKASKGYVIEIDNQEKISLAEDVIIFFKLFKNHEITPDLLEEIKLKNVFYEAYDLGIKYTSSTYKSRYSVYVYLLNKGYSNTLVNEVLDKLSTNGLINELEYANLKATGLIKKGYGAYYIRMYLKEERVGSELIEQLMDKLDTSEFIEYGKKIALKQKRNYQKYPLDKQNALLRAFLIRRGYSYPDIDEIL